MAQQLRLGWIGLGAMGGPMAAASVREGFTVFGYDIADAARSQLEDAGGTAVTSPAEAAADAEIVVIMVATPDQVEDVLFGPDGVAETIQSGSVVLIMSTVGSVITDWAERLSSRGIAVVDAPVSGGVARAASGDLLIMPSGEQQPLRLVRPLLVALGASAEPVGTIVGDGQRMKLVNQLLCGAHIVAAAEALSLARALGLDPKAAWDVVRRGAAGSFMLDDRGSRMLEDDPDVRSAVDIFVKDMGLVLGAAADAGVNLVLASAASDVFARARAVGLGRADDSAVIRTYSVT